MRMLLVLLCLMAPSAWAISIADVAGIASIAASSGSIIREGSDVTMHFKRTMRKHGSDLKRAFKGKPVAPPPVPFPVKPLPPAGGGN